MNKYLMITLIVLSLPWLTDRLVDAQFSEGYSQSDISALHSLQDRAIGFHIKAEPVSIYRPARPKQHMSVGEQASVLIDLGWGQP